MNRIKNYFLNSITYKFSPHLKELIIFITNKCNLFCQHCFYANELRKPVDYLKLEDYEKFINSLKKPLINVILTGGEPFLDDNFVMILKLFNDLNKTRQITVPTNGRAVEIILRKTEEGLKVFKGNLHIQVSLDGFLDYHNKLRGDKESFQCAVKTILYLKALTDKNKNLTIGVNTTVSTENIDMLNDLADFVNRKLSVAHNFELIRGVNYLEDSAINKKILSNFKPKEKNLLVPNDRQIAILNQILDKIILNNIPHVKDLPWFIKPFFYAFKSTQEFYLSQYILKRRKQLKTCKAGRSMGVIYPNGDFAFCEMTKVIANLREYDFDLYRLWNDKKNRAKSKMLKCYCTHGCFTSPVIIYDNKMRTRLLIQFFKFFLPRK